jgi:D-aspartate ligase
MMFDARISSLIAQKLLDCHEFATPGSNELPPVVKTPTAPRHAGDPCMLVLARAVTGLDVVRCLGRAGIPAHAIYFRKDDPVRFSRFCRSSFFDDSMGDEDALLRHIISVAQTMGNFPIVVPTCDAHALMLSRNAAALQCCCRVLVSDYPSLIEVVSKDRLYAHAQAAGLDTLPGIVAPTLTQVTEWSQSYVGPYLVKPFYVGVPGAAMKLKNLTIESREALISYVTNHDMDSLIVQRLIQGGDGYIFDCYGYCNRDGQVLAMATKRRWRQEPPDFGTCTMGEIPARLDGDTDGILRERTKLLFIHIHYHGIFGVEWLCDRTTGRFYLIDFNARPFMSIAHVAAAGLNLPALAYAEMTSAAVDRFIPRGPLKHLFGLDLVRDVESLIAKRTRNELGVGTWLRSILRCRHFYYASWRDPLPGIARFFELLQRSGRYVTNVLYNPRFK